MTRINCVPVAELTDAHLGAEYRELPRVIGLVRAAIERGESPGDRRNPQSYVLGPGHVRFFYARLAWVKERYEQIVDECDRRGRRARFRALPFGSDIPVQWWGMWTPDAAALALNRARIAERSSNIKERVHARKQRVDHLGPRQLHR